VKYIGVKEALNKIFKGLDKPSNIIQQVKNEDIADLEFALQKMCGKVQKQLEKKTQEIVDYSSNGQWNITKAVKEGPSLNYGKTPKAPKQPATLDYSKTPKAPKQPATLDYSKTPKAPKYMDAVERIAEQKAKLPPPEASETAAQTIARRQKMNKNDIVGGSSDASLMTMSEKEPHDDDRKHEEKEKAKATSIKEKAQEILDMHKADKESHSVFLMAHSHDVLGMSHEDAKNHLHEAVNNSKAKDSNKTKIKAAINNSKGVKDLSQMVANHVLAAGGKDSKVGSLKVIPSARRPLPKSWRFKESLPRPIGSK